jgi:hypothetical protein
MSAMISTPALPEQDNCPPTTRNASIHGRVLHEACLLLGGEAHLAAYLQVPVSLVDSWLKGRSTPPDEVFLKCLDLLEKK